MTIVFDRSQIEAEKARLQGQGYLVTGVEPREGSPVKAAPKPQKPAKPRPSNDQLLVWSESFAVGHEGLDKEHRRLVMLINQLCTAYGTTHDLTETARVLRALTAATKRHTRHETLVLRKFLVELEDPQNRHAPHQLRAIIDAAIEDHLADHGRLLERLGEFTRAVQSDQWTEGTSLCQEVEAWFLNHAMKYDLQIKAIIQSMRRPS